MLADIEVEGQILNRLRPFAQAFVTITGQVMDDALDYCPFIDPRDGLRSSLRERAAVRDFRLVSILRSRLMETQFMERVQALERIEQGQTLPVPELWCRIQRTAYVLRQVQLKDPLRFNLKMATMQALNPVAFAGIIKGLASDLYRLEL